MQRRRFGRTGLEVPALTFGGGWVGGLLIRGSQEVREGVLNKALARGHRLGRYRRRSTATASPRR